MAAAIAWGYPTPRTLVPVACVTWQFKISAWLLSISTWNPLTQSMLKALARMPGPDLVQLWITESLVAVRSFEGRGS